MQTALVGMRERTLSNACLLRRKTEHSQGRLTSHLVEKQWEGKRAITVMHQFLKNGQGLEKLKLFNEKLCRLHGKRSFLWLNEDHILEARIVTKGKPWWCAVCF